MEGGGSECGIATKKSRTGTSRLFLVSLFEWRPSLPAGLRGQAAWSVEECARFAALRMYELLQLLSRDKKALPTARRLGLSLCHPQPQATAQRVNSCWWWACDAQRTGSCCSAGV
eukprot:4786269-Prymnesium_polylepis.1